MEKALLEDVPGLPINLDDSDKDYITLQSVTNFQSCQKRLLLNRIMQRQCIRTFVNSFYFEIVMNFNWEGGHLEST